MECYRKLLLALSFGVFATIQLVQAQPAQQGFISLDCGLPPGESPYTDPVTGLTFSSDADFIESGKRGEAGDDVTYTYRQYKDLRYFPDGIRNCYNLIVNKGINYLIRAGFSYGNYDGLNVYPKFDLHVGPNMWIAVDLDDENDREIIYMTKSNVLQICLVKTGVTIPMISTLELRPSKNDSYMTQFGPLNLIHRRAYTSDSRGYIRYPNDVFDRKWDRYSWFETDVNTTLNVASSNPFLVPNVVSRSGISPKNTSKPMFFYTSLEDDNDKVIVYFHFAEIQDLKGNDTREFDIELDEKSIHKAYSPKVLLSETIYNTSPQKCRFGACAIYLVRTQRSTLPPLINAMEAFNVLEFLYVETNPNDVTALKNIQTTYGLNIISWQGDPCLPEQLKWKGVEDLSANQLSGSIASSFQNLTELQKLDLSSNSLSGGLPEFLANMKSLLTINLSWNNLKGTIPQALRDREKNGLKLVMQGNPKLCQTDECKNSNTRFLVPVAASIASFTVIVVVLVLIFFAKKKTKLKGTLRISYNTIYSILKSHGSVILTKKKRFTYSEVEAMTNNFERVLGEGGFGVVYHGSLNDSEHVAVKLLAQSSTQGYKQFKAEVELLLRVHHTNLVNLVGYCIEEDQLALVYEFASNGDLKQHLLGESQGVALNWASRLRIAMETAQGLEYLHIGCEPPMIHRDVKTTNILLDENYQAKLADFGLSRSFPIGVERHMSTNVAGTPGYLDPEYFQTNWLTEKSDVYSFGIVLLEMITSQPVIQQSRKKPHIAEWVGLMLKRGDIENIMDPNLHGDYDSSSVWKALELAISCVNPSSLRRPSMTQVVSELKECLVYEDSKKGRKSDMDSNISLELSTSFTVVMTPEAR
ncbi:unnamed protein product [Arabidopsis halleri]